MDAPDVALGLGRRRAAWRWAANAATLGILALGLLALAWGVASAGLPVAVIIVAAALLDGADGALARRAGGPSRTGAVLDILGDFTAFGLAPAALALARSPAGAWPLVPALAVYLAAALARLVRSARLALGRKAAERRPNGLYVGLPMPTAGCLVAGLALALPAGWLAGGLSAALLLISLLAVSRRPYPSVPWLWRWRRASLVVFLPVVALLAAWSPSLGLVLTAATCALYPWLWPVSG
jgi:CDP-diacylglycerol--serine O-phosphatidyltransferase